MRRSGIVRRPRKIALREARAVGLTGRRCMGVRRNFLALTAILLKIAGQSYLKRGLSSSYPQLRYNVGKTTV